MGGKFGDILKTSVRDYLNNFIIVIPALVLWVIILLGAAISGKITNSGCSFYLIVAWMISFTIVIVFIMSLIFSGMICMAKGIALRRKEKFFKDGKKFALRNFLIMIIMMAVAALITAIGYYGVFYLGKFFVWEVGLAKTILVLFYIIGILGIEIFFMLSLFTSTIYNIGVWGALKKSFMAVKGSYIAVLVIFIILNALFYLTGKINEIAGGLIEYLILIPFTVILLTRFLLDKR